MCAHGVHLQSTTMYVYSEVSLCGLLLCKCCKMATQGRYLDGGAFEGKRRNASGNICFVDSYSVYFGTKAPLCQQESQLSLLMDIWTAHAKRPKCLQPATLFFWRTVRTLEMRSRSNSGVRLDGYARLVQQTILSQQVSEARTREEALPILHSSLSSYS